MPGLCFFPGSAPLCRDIVLAALGAHPAVAGEQDGVALDVAVDDALVVQVGQGSQHGQTHGGNLLLVHPATARGKDSSVLGKTGEGDVERQQFPVSPTRASATSPVRWCISGAVSGKKGEMRCGDQPCSEVWLSLPAALQQLSVPCAVACFPLGNHGNALFTVSSLPAKQASLLGWKQAWNKYEKKHP